MDLQKFVDENQFKKKPFTKVEVLEAIQREMSDERADPATSAVFEKTRFEDKLVEDLRMDGFVVDDYQDVHSPFPQIKVDWSHLVK